MRRPGALVKEEGGAPSVLDMDNEEEQEVVERQHLRQHARPLLLRQKHNRAMPRLHFPTASRLYDSSHTSMADIL